MLVLYLSMLENEDDKLTFTEIYETLKQRCYHVALRITKNSNLAEDAVHEAFISVIKHKDSIFRLSCEKRASKIVIITKNKAIDIIRVENRHNHTPFNDEIISPHNLDIGKIIEDSESYSHLLNCISKLPEKYKSVAEMRYVLDMNNVEIAELLGIKPQAVSMRINRAKIMLQDKLDIPSIERLK